MTYEEAMNILDSTPEESFNNIFAYKDNIPMAILYVKNRTGCVQEVAEKIVFETLDGFQDIKPIEQLTITCPYCQSIDVKKITTTGRMFSMGFFGLASSKVGKQWHCNKCKSDF